MDITSRMIVELERDLVDAIKRNDTVRLDDLLHDKMRFLGPGGNVVTKAMDLDAHRDGQMVANMITFEMEDIQVIDDMAVAVVVYHTEGVMLGEAIRGRFRYIRFWRNEGDVFRIIGGSCQKLQLGSPGLQNEHSE